MSRHNQINKKKHSFQTSLKSTNSGTGRGGLCGEGAQKTKGPSEIPSPFPIFAHSDIT